MRRPSGRWLLLGVALSAQVGYSIPEQGLPTIAGFLKADLKISAAVTGLAVSSFVAGKLLGSYPAGLLVDRLGEIRVLAGGAIVTALLLAGSTVSPLPFLFGVLVLAGIASAGSTPAGGRLVLNAFAPHERGLALGIRQTGIPLGGLVAALALPSIAAAVGWRWSFLFAAFCTLLLAVPLFSLRARTERPERRVAGVERGRVVNREVRLLTAWSCLQVTGQFTVLTFLPLDAHERAGLTLPQAALLVGIAQVCGVAGRVVWGLVSDRRLVHGRLPILLALTGAGALAALSTAAIPGSASIWPWIAVSVLLGVSVIGYQGIFVTMLTEAAARDRVGAATGFAITFTLVAAAATPPLLGLVADLTGSYRSVWVVLFLALMAAFVPALRLGSPRPVRVGA